MIKGGHFGMRHVLSICLETFTPISTSLRGFNFAAKSLTNRSYTSTWYSCERGSSKNSTSFSVIWCHSLNAGENETHVSTRLDSEGGARSRRTSENTGPGSSQNMGEDLRGWQRSLWRDIGRHPASAALVCRRPSRKPLGRRVR